jgi:hypothetical protein
VDVVVGMDVVSEVLIYVVCVVDMLVFAIICCIFPIGFLFPFGVMLCVIGIFFLSSSGASTLSSSATSATMDTQQHGEEEEGRGGVALTVGVDEEHVNEENENIHVEKKKIMEVVLD